MASNPIYTTNYKHKLYALLSLYSTLSTLGFIVNTLTVVVLVKMIPKEKRPQYRLLLLMLAFCDYGKMVAYMMVSYDMSQIAIAEDVKAVAIPPLFCSITLTFTAISDFGFIAFVTLISIYRHCFICHETLSRKIFSNKYLFASVLLFGWSTIVLGVFCYLSSWHCEHSDSRIGMIIIMKANLETVLDKATFFYCRGMQLLPLCVPIFCLLTWRQLRCLRKKIITVQCTSTHNGETALVIQIAVIWLCWIVRYVISLLVYGSNSVDSLFNFLIQILLNTMYLLVNMLHPYIYLIFDSAFRKEVFGFLTKLQKPRNFQSNTI